jgi:hypothetical protein
MTFPQALKRINATGFMSELKLRAPKYIVAEDLEQNEEGLKLAEVLYFKPGGFLQGLKPGLMVLCARGLEAPAS